MNVHNQGVRQWADNVQAYTDEIAIYQQTKKLEVPLFFVHFLHLLLSSFPIPTERARLYGVATTLLKMGLDTHIQVSHRPMDVLAGDYLSIQFYFLLSEQGEVEGISHIAKTISQINEWNMEHHLWQQQSAPYDSTALELLQHISSALILSVADFFRPLGGEEAKLWDMLIPCICLINEVCSSQLRVTPSAESNIRLMVIRVNDVIPQFKSRKLQEDVRDFLELHLPIVKEGIHHEHALCTR